MIAQDDLAYVASDMTVAVIYTASITKAEEAVGVYTTILRGLREAAAEERRRAPETRKASGPVAEEIRCTACGYVLGSGGITGEVYCAKCAEAA